MILYPILALTLLAQSTNQDGVPPKPAPLSQFVKEVGPDKIEFKGILMEKKKHRISFPATINQREGLIEYALVGDSGKTHESLFATKMLPHDIHLALLLIGLKEDSIKNPNETPPPSSIDSKYLKETPKLKGAPVLLSVTWTKDGKSKEVPMEEWIFNLQTHHPMTKGPWTYNGSFIAEGVFLADQEQSIIAAVTDPSALVNNPRDGYDNDQIWQLRKELVPPLDTPVEITITLVEPTITKP